MQDQMFGVILWTDSADHRAVIWCEDHGNLAYYTGGEHSLHDGIELDAGDLIQFDVKEDSDMRRARNLRRVDAGHAPSIVHELRSTSGTRVTPKAGDNIVSFPETRRAG